jgi:hypothetical protein
MFDALGRSGDRELALVNLDLLDVLEAAAFPPRRPNFILYPIGDTRSARITIPLVRERQVRLAAGAKVVTNALPIRLTAICV